MCYYVRRVGGLRSKVPQVENKRNSSSAGRYYLSKNCLYLKHSYSILKKIYPSSQLKIVSLTFVINGAGSCPILIVIEFFLRVFIL